MTYTNLYLVFRKMKQEKFTGLPGMSENDYSDDNFTIDQDIELNAKINSSIKALANMPLVAEEINRDIYGNYTVVRNDEAKYMKLLHYGGYKFLFFEYGEFTILINYGKVNLSYFGGVNTWEYLPNKDEQAFYRHIDGTRYFMVNTFESFCKYLKSYLKVYHLDRRYNTYFYDDAINVIHTQVEFSTEYNSIEEYLMATGMPSVIQHTTQDKAGNVSFTFFVHDYLVIMVDFDFVPLFS